MGGRGWEPRKRRTMQVFAELGENNDNMEQSPDQFVFVERSSDGNVVAKGTQVQDYLYRGTAFKNLCMWDFVSGTEKSSMQYLKRKHTNSDNERCDDEDFEEEDLQPLAGNGRTPLTRDQFLGDHPECKTHFPSTSKRRKRIYSRTFRTKHLQTRQRRCQGRILQTNASSFQALAIRNRLERRARYMGGSF